MTGATTREQPADPATSVARTAVVVPAYQPDARLVALVDALRAAVPESPVVVVDDGSDRRCGGGCRAARARGAVGHPVPGRRCAGHGERARVPVAQCRR